MSCLFTEIRKAGLAILLLCCLQQLCSAQASFKFTIPAGTSVCSDTATYQLKVTNVSSADTFKTAKLTYRMPSGLRYIVKTVSGTGVSESNTSSPSAPIFTIPNLKPGDSVKLTFKVVADCGIISFINSGGTLKNLARIDYSKGKDSAYSSAFSLNIPSLNISKITNQSFVGSPGDTFSRFITLTNTASGKIASFTFWIIRSKDVKIDSIKGRTYTLVGDTLKFTFGDSDFKKIGNGDKFFDKNETLVLQEYLTIKGCGNLSEKFIVNWGCNNKICETASTTANVVINQIYPDLAITPNAYQSTCLSKFLDNKQSLTIKNKGNGPALNVVIDVFQTIYYPGGFYDTVQSRIDENSIMLKLGSATAKLVKADSLYKTTAKPCLSYTKPIGRFIKIIPIIKAGETIEISWNVYSCCVTNGYVNTWGYNIDYTEQCKNKNYTTGKLPGNYRHYQNFSPMTASTKDLIVNDTVAYQLASTGYNELFAQGNKPRLTYELTFPTGVNVKASAIKLNNYTGSPTWKATSAVVSGSKVTLTYSFPPPTGFDLSNSYLDMGLGVDTSGGKGKCGDVKDIVLKVKYTADDTCGCTQTLLQDTFQVKFNCANPKKIGLQNLSLKVERTSFGLPDNNDDGAPDASGALNFSKIATDRAMYGDTFKVDFKGIVRVKGTPSIWHFGIADIKFSEDYFTPVGFEIRIVDSANSKVYTCDKIPYYEKNGASYRFFFHYDSLKTRGCSTTIASGYRYRSGDSIQIKILYKVTTNNYGIKKVRVDNVFFFGGNPNPTKLKDYYYVDNFPATINIIGYYHTNYGYPPGTHTGCGAVDIMQSFYLSIGPCCSNYYGGNIFPYEYRNWSHLTNFKVVLPAGYSYISALQYYYPTQGTGKYGVYTDNLRLSQKLGDTLIFNTDSLYKPYGGSLIYSDDGYAGTLVVKARASCETQADVYNKITQYQTYEQDKKLSGGKYVTLQSANTIMWQRPNLNLQAALQTVSTYTDTFSWKVYISNLHGSADINKAWISFQSNDSNITVDSVISAKGKKFEEGNGIFKLDSLKAGSTKIITIKASTKACNLDSVKLVFGWNCDDYPQNIDNYKCPSTAISLYAEPKQPGIQIKTVSAPYSLYLCDTAKYTLEITNTKPGYAKESEVFINMVPGTKLVSGTSYLEYPIGSGYKKVSDPDSLNPYLFRYNASEISSKIASAGLPGITDTTKNIFRIRFGIVTDCDYISGSFVEFGANSYNLCHTEINKSTAISPALYLKGAISPYFSRITMRNKGLSACGKGDEVIIRISNLGNSNTDSTDNVFITLPKGIKIDDRYFRKIKNAPNDSSRKIVTFNGQTRVEWILPKGIVSGDSSVFAIWLKADSNLTCSSLPIFIQSTTKKALTCITNNTTCFSKIETGRLYQDINIRKPSVAINLFSAFAENNAPYGEKINITTRIKNAGDTLIPGKGQVIRYYLDIDGNSKLSSADKLIGTDTLKTTLRPNTSYTFNKTFTVAAGKNCALISYWDSAGTNCSCAPNQAYLNKIPLLNAGKDTAVCFGQQVIIGQDSIAGYKYSWSPGNFLADSTQSITGYTGNNTGSATAIQRLILTTTRIGNCSIKDTIYIKSYPKFIIDAGFEKTICKGSTVTLGDAPTAKGGSGIFTYKWSPKNGLSDTTSANPKATPLTSTTYKLTVTQNGCTLTDSIEITVLPVPNVDAGTDKTICKGDTVILGGSTVASGAKAPYTYYWSPSTALSSSSSANPQANPASTTAYILTVTDANGCKGYDTVTIKVNNNPVANAGNDANICSGDSIKLGGNPTASGSIFPYTYIWNPSTGLSNSKAANPYAKPAGTTTYIVNITDANGCKSIDSVKITVNSLPVVKAGTTREICFGDTTVLGSSPTASGGSGTYTYLWSPNTNISSKSAANPKVYPKITTTYLLKVTDAKGCIAWDSVKVAVNKLPVVEAGKNDTICEQDTIQLKATSAGNYTYSWSPGKWMNDSTVLKPYIYPSKNASFILTATDAKGCVKQDTINIFVRSRKALNPPVLKCVSLQDSNKINITWDTIANSVEFDEYRLYRVDNKGNTILLTGIKNNKKNTFSDISISDAHKKQYRYFLSTWNKCQVESRHSDTIGTIILTAVKVGDKILNLNWSAPYNKSLKYALESNSGTGFKWLDSTYKTQYQLQSCSSNAIYRISVSLNANCTVTSNLTNKLQLKDSTPPADNKLVKTTVQNWQQIQVQFTASDSTDVKFYEVYRAKNNDGFASIAIIKSSSKIINYTDTGLSTNKNNYTYKIRAKDTCGNYSNFTNLHTPVLLQAKAGNYEAFLSWNKYAGFNVKRQELQSWKNGTWQSLKTLSASDTNYIDKPLTCDITRFYRLKIIATDSAISSYSDSVIVTPFDTLKPQVPVLNYVSVNPNSSVTIKWDKVADADVKNYIIYRKSEHANAFTVIDTLKNVNIFTDKISGLNDSVWMYAVAALDSCAMNRSAISAAHNTILLIVKTKTCEQAAYLSWNAYNSWKDGVNQYYIFRSKNSGSEVLIDSTNNLSWKDADIDYHNSFTYRISAKQKNGSAASSSNTGTIKTIDPGTPEVLFATKLNSSSTAGEILIKWNIKNPSIYTSYRKLFYRGNKDSAYKILADNIPLNQDSFLHTGLNTRVGYHDYFMQTVDSCGNISDSSSNHTPIDLTVKVGQLVHELHWSAYKGWPKNTYVVQKWNGSFFADMDTIPGTDTSERKFPAPCNSDIFYRIKALGPNGQVSYSDTMGGRAIDTIPADAPIMKNVSVVSGNTIRIDFTGADSADIYAYAIQRGERGSWTTAGQVLFTSPHDNYIFTDTTTPWKEQICYTIITLDSCLNATSSDTFCTIQLGGSEKNLSNLLSWKPFVGYIIDSYRVEVLSANKWDTLAIVNGADTTYFHAPLPCNVPVTYRIAGAPNNGLVTYSDTVTLVPYDTIKPQAPVLDYISVINKNSFEAHWQLSTDKDVKLYELQWRTENGKWNVTDTADRKTAYIVSGKNTLDSTYFFRVVAIDSCAENRSVPSVQHKTIQLQGKPQNLSNLLQWNIYEGFTAKNYVIYKWKSNTWNALDTVSANKNSYLDTGLQCNVAVAYKVSALAKSGGFISYSDSISLIPYDTIKPPAPLINYATVNDKNTIALYWQKSVPDVKLYEVSLQAANGSWNVIDTVYEQLQYTIPGLNTTQNAYCLRVAAIDSCAENKSAYSTAHCPIQLDGKAANLSNNLYWSAYRGFPVSKYYIYTYAKKWLLLDSVTGSTTQYLHDSLACNVPQIYKVGALDMTGKFLSFSDSVLLTPFDTVKPPKPALKYATVLPDHNIQLACEWNTSSDVKYFEIWRQEDNNGWNKITTVVYDSQFVDKQVNPQTSQYKYFAIAVDSCNGLNRSMPSDTDKIINLKYTTGGCIPLVNLYWNPYTELPQEVDKYEILRSDDGLNFTTIASVSANVINFKDTLVQEGKTYQYKIKATDNESGYYSFSDSVAVTPWIFPVPGADQIVYTSVQKTGKTNGEIFISWHKYNFQKDTFARGYKLYRATSNSPYKLVYTTNNPNDTAYIDVQKNTSDSLHFYYVSVYNSCNINGPQSVAHQPLNLSVFNFNLEEKLSWNTYKGTLVSYYEIYKSRNRSKPVKIATLNNADTVYNDTNILCKQLYSYQVFAHLANGSISTSDIESVTSFDTIPPQKPDVFALSIDKTAYNGEVSLIFTGNKEKNRSGYRIFTKDRAGLFYAITDINETRKDTVTIIENTTNTTAGSVEYFVSALDSCGNMSMPSDTHKTVFLKAQAYSNYIQLNWSAYIGFDKNYSYIIQRRTQGGSFVNIAKMSPSSLSFADTTVECHIYYDYKILTVEDISGAKSYSNITGDTAFENELPEAPEIKYISVLANNAMDLEWKPSASADAAFYHLYRSGDFGASWQEILTPILGTTYLDTAINTYENVYYYKLQTEDKCGNLSTDFSAPHGSIKLRAIPGNELLNVNWNAYYGWMPDGYKLYRDGNLLATLTGNTLNYTDTNVICTNLYRYKVMAYRNTDSVFSWSNADATSPFDLNKPGKVYLQTATVSLPNKNVTLLWEASQSKDVKGYKVWRKSGKTGFYEFVDSTLGTSFTDSLVAITASDCYFIEPYDYCGNMGDWSNAGCIIVLTGESKAGINALNWNAYRSWKNGINNYKVYRNIDSSGWQNIGATTGLNYDDITLPDSSANLFCYKVEALENSTSFTSFSTVTCMHQQPVVYIPNAFSPDASGYNDNFSPQGLYIKSYKIEIFNRWGQIIYENKAGKGWDGKFENALVPEGLYMYKIIVESYTGDKKWYNGTVMLLR